MLTVSTSKAYHHGDLRAALLAAGLKALESREVTDISLRQLARDVGVSATAVYRHFPDKDALFSALAEQGIEQLAAWQAKAAQAADQSDAFSATGRAYVHWALANPALFKLLFGHCESIGDTVFGPNAAARMLHDFAQRLTGDEEETQRLMIQAWALVHGLAMLMLDGQLPRDEAMIDRVIDTKSLFRP